MLSLHAPERCAAISTLTHHTKIAEPVPKHKRRISLLVITERGRVFSNREDSYGRLVDAGFSDSEHMGDKAARQRFKLFLRMKLNIYLFCSIGHNTVF